MRILAFAFLTAMAVLIMDACQKEYSYEGGNTRSEGLLQSNTTGDCFPKTVTGTYEANVVLNATTHTIEVAVEVTNKGSYTIYSDTINGVFFRASGNFTTTGMNTITLPGSGTPAANGPFVFEVHYNGQVCSVAIHFGPLPAVFTTNCGSTALNGHYEEDKPLDATNTLTLTVNVTAAGPYSITTPEVNGMIFSGSGILAIGSQTIILTGTGIPTTDGNFDIVVPGSPACTLPLEVDPSPGPEPDWKFAEGIVYKGPIISSTLELGMLPPPGARPIARLYYNGRSVTGDTLIRMLILDYDDAVINVGDVFYAVSNGDGNVVGLRVSNFATGADIYKADATFQASTFSVTITVHNPATKYIEAIYSGIVANAAGNAKMMTAGKFRGTYQ